MDESPEENSEDQDYEDIDINLELSNCSYKYVSMVLVRAGWRDWRNAAYVAAVTVCNQKRYTKF